MGEAPPVTPGAPPEVAKLPEGGKPEQHRPRPTHAHVDLCSPHRQKADEAQPLEGGRYRTHGNGTLQINETSQDDAGAYSCWVENAKGKAAVTANLDVRSNSPPLLLHAGPGPPDGRGGPLGPQRVPACVAWCSLTGAPGGLGTRLGIPVTVFYYNGQCKGTLPAIHARSWKIHK